jgi:hypothetical protein
MSMGIGEERMKHMSDRMRLRRPRGPAVIGFGLAAMAISALFAAAVLADGGTWNLQVNTDSDPCPTVTTTGLAKVTYLTEDNPCGLLGASGTGVFESFERLQASPNEEGFNTDTNKVLDNVDGQWTHSILVSDIPVINEGGTLYWELFADINEGNGGSFDQPHISLNDVEVWFTTNPGLTTLGTTQQYDFSGAFLINDVNSGSGRADLRYLIPITNVTIPSGCGFKDPACATYFVLYSQWGLTENYTADDEDFFSDSGFEEWKVKNYPYVTVSKTANTTFTRTFAWTIDKSVTPATWNLFTGDTGTSDYTVTLTKGAGVDSAWAVSGTISINNPGTLDAVISSVSDVISGAPTTATVVCPWSFPHTLAAGASTSCTYSAPLPNGTSQTNTATVTLSAGTVFQGTAAVTFGSPTTTVNGTVHVTDTYAGGPQHQAFSSSGSATYSRTFACDADSGTHGNTATIDETGQNDSASVTVNCYALGVTKDADTSLSRKYTWSIDKSSSDPTNIILNPGETFLYHYSVTVNVTGHTDSAWAASGDIHVNNPAPIAATINGVSDVISGGITATVACGVSFPYTLAAGATLDCTYSATLPDATDRTNTATATLQNHAYASNGTPTNTGTTNFSGTAAVSFASATITEVDECIAVTDSQGGSLGTVCVGDAPETFLYTKTFGPYTSDECGDHPIHNVATLTTNDTGATGNDTWDVIVTVPCPEGCTLTQGYWKTHSVLGPAKKADPTWDLVGGPNATFFLSGQTWYQVFWTAPKGNAYYILAHQYEAAKLNILSGADSTTAVDNAITAAETFFNTYTPTNWPKSMKNQLTTLAGILGSYNEGLTGPGHCSEDTLARSAPA